MNDNKQQGGKTNNKKHNRLTLNCTCQKCLERKQQASNPIVSTSSDALSSNANVLSPNNIDHVSTNFSTPLATSTPTKPRVIKNANEEPKNSTEQCNKHGQTFASTLVTAQKMMANTKIVTTTNHTNEGKDDHARKRLPTKRKHVRTEPLPKKAKLHQKSILNYFGKEAPANVATAESDNEEVKTTKQLPASNNNNVQPAAKSSAIEQSPTAVIVISSDDDEDENKTTTTKPSTSSNMTSATISPPKFYGSEWDTDGEQTIAQNKREAEKQKRKATTSERNARKRVKAASSNSALSNDQQSNAKRKNSSATNKTKPAKKPSTSASNITAKQLTAALENANDNPNAEPKRRKAGKRFTAKKDRQFKSITVVKCALQSLLIDNGNRARIVNFIEDMCRRATKIAVLGSLATLSFINEAYDSNLELFENYLSKPIQEQFEAVCMGRLSSDHIGNLTTSFRTLLDQSGIDRPSRAYLNNAFKKLYQRYEDTFRTNIKTHGKKRVQLLFRLWFIEENDRKPTKQETKHMAAAANFIFNGKSKATRNNVIVDQLVDRFMDYVPPTVPNDLNPQNVGFMQHLLWRNNWHRVVPLFIKIQRDIDWYQHFCRLENKRIWVSNFAVVPIHSNLMKHIQIDTNTLIWIISHLKLWPQHIPRKFPVVPKEGETDYATAFWYAFFDKRKMQRLERNDKKFGLSIVTDSVAVSIQMNSNKDPRPDSLDDLKAKQQKQYRTFGQRYKNNEYDQMVGLDPGYKLFLAGIARDNCTNEETQIKISSKKYYNMTRQNIRDRKCTKWTEQFETKCRIEREEFNMRYNTVMSPQSRTYPSYIAHRLRHVDEALSLYTTRKYTRTAFDQYKRAQSTMDRIVNAIVTVPANSQKRCLIAVGGTEFPSNSPIKKYRRCPGLRKLVTAIKKRTNCDVVFVDEYNTSQTCARCFRKFKTTQNETEQHKRWESKGLRHRNCADCKPTEHYMQLPAMIYTKQSPRIISTKLAAEKHTAYTTLNITYDEAERQIMQTYYQFGDVLYEKTIAKEPQSTYNANQRVTPLKCVWNRDVSAGRNILIKAICLLTKQPNPVNLQRPRNEDDEEDQDNEDGD